MGDLKTTQEEREARHWCPDCGAWQPGRVCPAAGVLHSEGMTYTASAYTHLRYCIDEGDDRVCHKDLREALDELDHVIPERDTLLAENAKLRAELERLREILAPRGLVELEPTVEESAVRVVSERDEAEARGVKLDVVAEAARDACNIYLNDAGPHAFATIATLRRALAALEAP